MVQYVPYSPLLLLKSGPILNSNTLPRNAAQTANVFILMQAEGTSHNLTQATLRRASQLMVEMMCLHICWTLGHPIQATLSLESSYNAQDLPDIWRRAVVSCKRQNVMTHACAFDLELYPICVGGKGSYSPNVLLKLVFLRGAYKLLLHLELA